MAPAWLQSLSPLLDLTSYHVLVYGTLIGSELFQTFVNTKVCYNALPMSAFTTLQKRIFPVYFRGQTLLLVLTALTVPPFGPASLVNSLWDVIPLTFAGAMAAFNMMVWGPKSQQTMIERIHQETKDGRKHNDPETVSDEMRVKNKAFTRAHAMCIHINLLAVGATLFYGFRLCSRFQLVEA